MRHRCLLLGVLTLASAACSAPAAPEAYRATLRAPYTFEGNALALAEAVDRQDADAVGRLMRDEGVNPDVLFGEEAIPVVAWPVINKNLIGLQLLLDNGADPNARMLDTSRERGQHRNNAMVYAAELSDTRYMALLLDHGGDPNTLNSNGNPITHVAWVNNEWPTIQHLVERGADINMDLHGSDGYNTPVNWYSSFGTFENVYWLLERGADPTRAIRSPPGSVHPMRMPVVDDIYWLPIKPTGLEWQKKCQQWLVAKGIPRQSMPEYLKNNRRRLGFPYEEEDIPLL